MPFVRPVLLLFVLVGLESIFVDAIIEVDFMFSEISRIESLKFHRKLQILKWMRYCSECVVVYVWRNSMAFSKIYAISLLRASVPSC